MHVENLKIRTMKDMKKIYKTHICLCRMKSHSHGDHK